MSNPTTAKLFSPCVLGTIALQHRVVMAPLTRLRSDQPGDIPGGLMAEYYAQRASPGGLIVTESTEITAEASAYEGAPGIYTEAQMAGWRQVVGAIQRKGDTCFCSFGIREEYPIRILPVSRPSALQRRKAPIF